MAKQTVIFERAIVKNYAEWDGILSALYKNGRATVNQYDAAKGATRDFLPAEMTILQRTDKGTLLIRVNDDWEVRVNNRAIVRIMGVE